MLRSGSAQSGQPAPIEYAFCASDNVHGLSHLAMIEQLYFTSSEAKQQYNHTMPSNAIPSLPGRRTPRQVEVLGSRDRAPWPAEQDQTPARTFLSH